MGKYSRLEYALALLWLGVLGAFIAHTAPLSKAVYGGPDEFTHFQIARWAIQYPHLWFDMWGKPVYNVLIHPFTYLGFYGSRAFSYVLLALGAWAVIRLSKNLLSGFLFMGMVLLSQGLFMMINSILTEVLFSVAVLWTVVFYQERKYWAWAFLLSTLPFIRHEGVVILAVFLLLHLWDLRCMSFTYLSRAAVAVGSTAVLLSIFSLLMMGDALYWIRNYESSAVSDYGKGSFLDYPLIFVRDLGWVSATLCLLILINNGVQRIAFRHYHLLIFAVLLLGFHSFLWGMGWGGAAGLPRLIGPGILFFIAFFVSNSPPPPHTKPYFQRYQ